MHSSSYLFNQFEAHGLLLLCVSLQYEKEFDYLLVL
jgi:hypothetical protein